MTHVEGDTVETLDALVGRYRSTVSVDIELVFGSTSRSTSSSGWSAWAASERGASCISWWAPTMTCCSSR